MLMKPSPVKTVAAAVAADLAAIVAVVVVIAPATAAILATNSPFAKSGDFFTRSLRHELFAGGFYF